MLILCREWFNEEGYESWFQLNERQYQYILNTFNIGIHKSKTDQCSDCINFGNGLWNQLDYDRHREFIEDTRKCKNEDKE